MKLTADAPLRVSAPTIALRSLVVSESPALRAGIKAMVPTRRLSVVGELDGPERLLDAVAETRARLVIGAPVDAGDSLFETLEQLPQHCASIVLLAVPSFRIQSSVLTSRDVRCLPLTVARGEFHAAVDEVLTGEAPVLAVDEVVSGPQGQLTLREQQVLRELALGKPNRDIAEQLWVSENTVKTHLRKIYRKLGVETRAEAVALYVGQLGSA
jgi:DNA-binding NarL/FixJ family response regulator